MVIKNILGSDGKSYKYFVQIKTKNKKEESVVEVVPNTVKFLDMGDKGHREIASQFKLGEIGSDVYNSPDVYDNNVGGEQVDGS